MKNFAELLNINAINSLIMKLSDVLTVKAFTKIALIIIFSIIFVRVIVFFTNKIRKLIVKSSLVNDERVALRAKTITGIINSLIIAFISTISVILILGELGINVAPIIAGAGVLGLAISFGAQNIVKDVITGFFILLEDQYGVGDIIKIDSHAGTVESMNLRTTILRDIEGNVHIIPNGEIKQVIVMTKHWSRALIDIQVFYKQDLQKIFSIINEEANKLFTDRSDIIIESPEILGIDSIDSNGVTIRIIMKTKPAEQWTVSREFRKRVIERFNEAGIDLPFFHSLGYAQSA